MSHKLGKLENAREFLYLSPVARASYHILIILIVQNILFPVTLWIPSRRVKNLSQNPSNCTSEVEILVLRQG